MFVNTAKGNSFLSEEKYLLILRFRFGKVGNSALFSICLIISLFIVRSPLFTQSSVSFLPLVESHHFVIDSHNIKIDIKGIEEVTVAEKYDIKNSQNVSVESIDLWFNHSLDNLVINSLEGPLEFERNQLSDSSNLITIYFTTELVTNSTTSFNVWYSLTNYPIPEQGQSYYFFEFYSYMTFFTKEQTIEIKIPERSSIHEEDGLTSFYPTESIPIAGKRVYIAWTFRNLEPFDNSFIFVRFDKPLGNPPIWPMIVGPFFGVVIGIIGTLLFMKRKEKKVMKKVATIFLSETQKMLLRLISENEGKILQKELCSKTGFTKSRVSRNITPLVEQKLVKRERWGRNYIIRLTENGKKVVE